MSNLVPAKQWAESALGPDWPRYVEPSVLWRDRLKRASTSPGAVVLLGLAVGISLFFGSVRPVKPANASPPLRQPEDVSYLRLNYLTPDGEFCVTNPVVLGSGVLATIARSNPDDPRTVMLVEVGRSGVISASDVKYGDVFWRPQFGDFATSTGEAVGSPRQMAPGSIC